MDLLRKHMANLRSSEMTPSSWRRLALGIIGLFFFLSLAAAMVRNFEDWTDQVALREIESVVESGEITNPNTSGFKTLGLRSQSQIFAVTQNYSPFWQNLSLRLTGILMGLLVIWIAFKTAEVISFKENFVPFTVLILLGLSPQLLSQSISMRLEIAGILFWTFFFYLIAKTLAAKDIAKYLSTIWLMALSVYWLSPELMGFAVALSILITLSSLYLRFRGPLLRQSPLIRRSVLLAALLISLTAIAITDRSTTAVNLLLPVHALNQGRTHLSAWPKILEQVAILSGWADGLTGASLSLKEIAFKMYLGVGVVATAGLALYLAGRGRKKLGLEFTSNATKEDEPEQRGPTLQMAWRTMSPAWVAETTSVLLFLVTLPFLITARGLYQNPAALTSQELMILMSPLSVMFAVGMRYLAQSIAEIRTLIYLAVALVALLQLAVVFIILGA